MTPPPSLLSEIAGWIDAGGERDERQ
jgi:hypothetical protein